MPKKSLSFSLNPLNPNFVGPKPIEEEPKSTFYALEAGNNLIIERKRTGNCTYTAIAGPKKSVRFYSSGINEWTANFPLLSDEVRSLNIPRDTLLAGEMLVQVSGTDDQDAFGSLAKSNTERSLALQKRGAIAQLRYFNALVYKGKSVITLPYENRLEILQGIVHHHDGDNVGLVEVVDTTFDHAISQSMQEKWEGLVLYDKRAGSAFHLNGTREKTPRPNGCWKWKDYKEGDFVATGWIPSTSKLYGGLVKDLMIAQYDPKTNKLVPWGKVGTGLSLADKKKYANDLLYPAVFEIQYERRTVNHKLYNAHILRPRDDKRPEECFSPE